MMYALVLLCINQHTKFEVPRFTNSKDIIEAKFEQVAQLSPTNPCNALHHGKRQNFKQSHDHNHAHLRGLYVKLWLH